MVKTDKFTHISEQGAARMVDISQKQRSERSASAYGEIVMKPEVAQAIKQQTIKKGEVLQVARLAGIMAAKRTFEVIPLCHVLALTKCELDFTWQADDRLAVTCETKTMSATGVEMEALTGVNVALLTSIEERKRKSMKDSFGRTIDYVRLSVTDRCELRCSYCMPATGACFLKKEALLSFSEQLFLMECLAEQGIRKVKITGGEPLTNKETVPLIRALKNLKGIETVTLTTNGVQLANYAVALKAAGLDGVNISLDTLDPVEFRQLTRVDALKQVLAGLETAIAVGLPTKINTVARRELSAATIGQVAALTQVAPVHVRFIELMPIGLGRGSSGQTQEEIMAILTEKFGPLTAFETPLGNGPATYYSLPGFQGKLGFISALGHCFCAACNRIRIRADGSLKTCLHLDKGYKLKKALATKNKSLLLQQLFAAVQQKPAKHHFLEKTGDVRLMSQIGG